MAIPKRLRRQPLIEVIWQAALDSRTSAPPGELLLGILYEHLRKGGAQWHVHALPLAQIPPFVAQQDPVLRYAVTHRLESEDTPILYQVGHWALSVNCRRPYVGWKSFRQSIVEVVKVVQETLPVACPASFSLRYLDLFTGEYAPSVSRFRLSVSVGDQIIDQQPLHLRVEVPYEGRDHVLQAISPSRVGLPNGEELTGILIDLETRAASSGSWAGFEEELEQLHRAAKAMFFEQVLTPELLEALEPEY